MNQHDCALRKAAILVAAVDGRTAELLLAQMGATEAAAVRRAAAALDEIPAAERDSVLAEFRQLAGNPGAKPGPSSSRQAAASRRRFSITPVAPGIDLCRHESPLSSAASEAPASTPPRAWLHRAGSDALAEHLSREQPQTIAVVFTRLPPQQAADVLRRLPDVLQTEVVERLASSDQVEPQVLRDIEQGLEAWLSEQLQHHRRGAAGLETASRLLEAAGYDLRQGVLANLARRDSALARRLASSPLQPTRDASGQFDLAASPPVDVTA